MAADVDETAETATADEGDVTHEGRIGPATSIGVLGVAGDLGARVTHALAPARVVDLAAAGSTAGLDAIVDLATAGALAPVGTEAGPVLAELDAVLERASTDGVPHVVVVSSAAVYGAHADNPVPLTEDRPLRPNPETAYAVAHAEVERRVGEWRRAHDGAVTATLLRPTPTVGDEPGPLARTLASTSLVKVDDPPVQLLHLDDLATAVRLAVELHLDGAYNVSPTGWIDGSELRRLLGAPPRLSLSQRAAERLGRLGWGLGLRATPPELVAYATYPWVVANDRLIAAGWSPRHTTEEAVVASHGVAPWAQLSPQRRQEVALAGMVAALVGAGVGVGALIRRRRRR